MNEILVSTLVAAAVAVLLAAVLGLGVRAVGSRLLGDSTRAHRLARVTFASLLGLFGLAIVAHLLDPVATERGLRDLGTGLVAALPAAVVGLLLLVVGLLVAAATRAVVHRVVTRFQPAVADLVAGALYWVIVVVTLLTAAEQLGIETGLVQRFVVLVAGGVVIAAALALGLGLRTLVEGVAAGRHVGDIVAVGDEVEVGAHTGEVVRLGSGSVRIDVGPRRVEIPNAEFLRTAVVVTPGKHATPPS